MIIVQFFGALLRRALPSGRLPILLPCLLLVCAAQPAAASTPVAHGERIGDVARAVKARPAAARTLVVHGEFGDDLAAAVRESPAAARTLVVYGDSISAAYGMPREAGWVALLGERLSAERPGWRLVNASVSGETTGGGLTRLAKTLAAHSPALLILELGGNDGLRGYPIAKIRENLAAMIRSAQAAGAKVLLVGMALPPNYGSRYTSAFTGIYGALAAEHRLAFVPTLLDGVATDRRLFQKDGIHPTAEAQPLILEDIWQALLPLLNNNE